MKIRNQNSSYTWQSRVREYDVIPNRTISTGESWKKLRERLDKAPQRKSRAWYWVAAASIVFFFVIKLIFTPGKDETLNPGFTKTHNVVKQNHQSLVPVDTLQTVANTTVETSDPGAKKPVIKPTARLQPLHSKKDSMLPETGNSVVSPVKDTPVVEEDIAQQPARLPSVHINDLINTEPLPKNISTKSLAIKRLILLFNIDFTKDVPLKKQEGLPKSQYTIPNNQN